MQYQCNVTLTQPEIDAVIAALESRASQTDRIRSIAAESALQKFLAVERVALLPDAVTP